MRLYNKWNMGLHRFTQAEDKPSRKSMCNVRCEENQTVATDGKCLITVTTPTVDVDRYPVPSGFDTDADVKDFSLSIKDAKAIEKRIPKKLRLPPRLRNVATVSDGVNTKMSTTDYDDPITTEHQCDDGKYPSYECVFPKKECTLKIQFNGQLLGKLLDYMGAFTEDYGSVVTLEFYNADTAVKLTAENKDTGQTATGLVMPLETGG